MNKAVFLDRDGTINRDSNNYIKNLSEFTIFAFSLEALGKLQNSGFKLIIITNQSGIGRNFISISELETINQYLTDKAKDQKIIIDKIYFCPHLPEDNCDCRKPKIGNILKAKIDYDIDLSKSWFIGDSKKDIKAGTKSGCKTILLLTGIHSITKELTYHWEHKPDNIVNNLLDAANLIIKQENINK